MTARPRRRGTRKYPKPAKKPSTFKHDPPKRGGVFNERRAQIALEFHGTPCQLGCGTIMDAEAPKGTPSKLTVDHIIPLAHGGTHERENLRAVCHACNSSRGTNTTWAPPVAPDDPSGARFMTEGSEHPIHW